MLRNQISASNFGNSCLPKFIPQTAHRVGSNHNKKNNSRCGFTLFEVSISLLLVTVSVISVLLIFPLGLKGQQVSRYKILAAVKAMEMIDSFSGVNEFTRSIDPETPEPWEGNNYAYTSTRFDLEARLCNWHSGLLPVPCEIARRLDSPGDEILNILNEGGYLYYSQPMANTNLDERWMAHTLPNDALRLVCAMSGYAQNNALPSLPWKEWPYRAPYPSPPVVAYLDDASMQSALNIPVNANGKKMYSWEWWFGGNVGRVDQAIPPKVDPLMNNLFKSAEKYSDEKTGNTPQNRKAYIASALAYGQGTFQSSITFNLPQPAADRSNEFATYYTPDPANDDTKLDVLGKEYDLAFAAFCKSAEMDAADTQLANKVKRRMDIVLRVQCMRFIAHSMMTLSMSNQIRDYNQNDKLVPSMLINNKTVTPGLLRYYHERSLAMIMRYASSFPYDWGAPRPAQRSIMMDHPLLEWDIFSQPRSGKVAGAVPAAMWKPISAQPISNLGPAASYSGSYDATGKYNREISPFPNWDIARPNQFWGNPAHFTLTKPFKPAERCRQIVFWAVDWQSYEDAETQPSAPLDASRAPLMGPRDSVPALTFANRSLARPWQAKENYHLLNPEFHLNFASDVSALKTGANIANLTMTNPAFVNGEQVGGQLKNTAFLNGMYGADRNYNGRLDRGTITRSVRLRAQFIARFNIYDPRLPIFMR